MREYISHIMGSRTKSDLAKNCASPADKTKMSTTMFESNEQMNHYLASRYNLKACRLGCTSSTIDECLKDMVFGSPKVHWCYVRLTIESYWEYSELPQTAVLTLNPQYRITMNTGWSLEQDGNTKYPAQVAIKLQKECVPLNLSDYYSIIPECVLPHHLLFELTKDECQALCTLMLSRTIMRCDPLFTFEDSLKNFLAGSFTDVSKEIGKLKTRVSEKKSTEHKNLQSMIDSQQEEIALLKAQMTELTLQKSNMDGQIPCNASMTNNFPYYGTTICGDSTSEPIPTYPIKPMHSFINTNVGAINSAGYAKCLNNNENNVVNRQIFQSSASPFYGDNPPFPRPSPYIFNPPHQQNLLTNIYTLNSDQSMANSSNSTDMKFDFINSMSLGSVTNLTELETSYLPADISICSFIDDKQILDDNGVFGMSYSPESTLTNATNVNSMLSNVSLTIQEPQSGGDVLNESPSANLKTPMQSAFMCPHTLIKDTSSLLSVFKESILFMGGFDGYSWSDRIDLWNPNLSHYLPFLDLPEKNRCWNSATLPGHIFALGYMETVNPIGCAWRYSIQHNTWTKILCPIKIYEESACVALYDRLFLIGGSLAQTRMSTVCTYDTTTDTWSQNPMTMIKERSNFAATVNNGAIFVLGGNSGRQVLQDSEFYDPREGIWHPIAKMSRCRSSHVSVTNGYDVYAIGGCDMTQYLSTTEVLDTRTNRWRPFVDLNNPRAHGAAAVINGNIYVVGGMKNKFEHLDTMEFCSLHGSDSDETFYSQQSPAMLGQSNFVSKKQNDASGLLAKKSHASFCQLL